MEKFTFKVTFALLILFTLSLQGKSKNTVILKVYTFNRPPLYIVKNNTFSGILVEKTRKILDKAGVSYKFIAMPPARILKTLRRERNACSIGWFKTKEREKLFIYSKPICSQSDYFVVAARKNLNSNFSKIIKSPLFSIALVNGFSYGEEIDNMLKNSKIRKFYIPNPDAKKLLLLVKSKRVDFAILSQEEAQFHLKQDGFKNDIKLIPFKKKTTIKRYIIFSKKTDRRIIEKINRAIEDLY